MGPCTCNPRKLRQEACGDPEEIKGKKKRQGGPRKKQKWEWSQRNEGRRREGMEEERKS